MARDERILDTPDAQIFIGTFAIRWLNALPEATLPQDVIIYVFILFIVVLATGSEAFWWVLHT